MNNNFISGNFPNADPSLRVLDNSVPNVFYHNFIINKKNVDGKLLFENFQMKNKSLPNAIPNQKLQNQKRRLLFDRRQKLAHNNKIHSEQKQINSRAVSSEGYRQKNLQAKITVKHIKTSQDTFLFKRSIDLKCEISLFENTDTFQKLNTKRKQRNPSRLIHLSFEKQKSQQYQKKNQNQCRVQRCNLLAKYLHQTSSVKRKQQLIIKHNSISRTRRSSYAPKIIWKKTLEDFIPKIKILEKPIQKDIQKQIEHFPNCKAKVYTVLLNNQIIFHKNGQQKRQIASLTKIMTCITALYLAQKFQLNIQNVQVKISREASNIGGTSANLKFGDNMTFKDILFGMMLPSGNDAAFAISEFLGRLLYRKSPEYQSKIQQMIKTEQIQQGYQPNQTSTSNSFASKVVVLSEQKKFSFISSIQAVQYFVQQMNELAKYLEMKRSFFINPHGLSDFRNKSTANDLVKLSYHCIKRSQKFRQIISTKYYDAKIFNKNSKMARIQKWMNSNLSLFDQTKQCFGIKTGNTPNAGPCLASYFKYEENDIVIILLSCQSKQERFKDVSQIYNFVVKSDLIQAKQNDQQTESYLNQIIQ